MRWACNRRCRSGLPARSPCRPNPGAAGGASLRDCDTTPIIGLSRPRTSRCACPPRPGKTSSGAKAPTSLCLRASPPCGSGRRRATTNSSSPHPVEWLVVEWPEGEAEPTKYWLSTLPEDTPLEVLVDVIKLRWRIERDYEELKSELGLAHFEGRGWRGFHHHASLCIAAYGFLILERSAFPPSARWRREKPALSGRSRSPRAPDPSRTPRAQLDRDDAQAIDDRPGKIPLSMPMLPSRLKAAGTSTNACDAVELPASLSERLARVARPDLRGPGADRRHSPPRSISRSNGRTSRRRSRS